MYYEISLRHDDGSIERLGHVEFMSLDEALADVRAARADAAADLVRRGRDPAGYCFLVGQEEDDLLVEVPLGITSAPPVAEGAHRPGA